ncbi:MAG: ADP-ribosylglycohydrolase family protein [Desmonostoc vinosum HA7617-LM4]|jgi:hypothetical protein|nr:ADP-ribosylglycohydrolase family protein [Desmonostoc vinosum HA7617-LM4]
MHYSLVSRFRGILLGAFLTEALAYRHNIHSPNIETLPAIPLHWGKIMVLGTESLITLGRFDLDDWLVHLQQASPHFNATGSIPIKLQTFPLTSLLATLPVVLFFHENPVKMRQNLLHVLKIWEDDPVIRDGTLAVGYAIAQSLTEKLDPLTLIPQIISFLGETTTSLPQQLLKVHTLLEQKAGLAKVQTELSKYEKTRDTAHSVWTIAMAFYCFLSTLEDFRLAVLRATDNRDCGQQEARLNSQITGAITGALSGAYNSTVGIPVNWQILLMQANSSAWGLTNFSQMLKLADALVAVWSGMYNHALHGSESQEEGGAMSFGLAPLSVYAAPYVIRSR